MSGELSLEAAHAAAMSANPWAQYDASVGMRNFAAAAEATAATMRANGRTSFNETGDAGVMAQAKAEAHAAWFDEVAKSARTTADHVDSVVKSGYSYQTTAETVYQNYQQLAASDTPGSPGGKDILLAKEVSPTTTTLNSVVDDWSDSYAAFKPASPPPVPLSSAPAGSGTGGSGGASYAASGSGAGSYAGSYASPAAAVPGHAASDGSSAAFLVPPSLGRESGDPGSVVVGKDGGDFAGWFKDPTTGYYVDPATGREYDPVNSRWIDPVTGKPFGDVTQYATGLQGLGGAGTTGGLLSNGGDLAGIGGAGGLAGAGGGLAGAGGGFAGLFSSGNAAGVTAAYGGVLPPSLSSTGSATSALWQQGGAALQTKAAVATSMVGREEAARMGRPYMPPAQAGGAGGGAGGARRASYATATEEESALFSSPGRGSARATAAEGEAEEAGAAGRRPYLPPAQAGQGKDKKGKGGRRPDWLLDDDAFSVDPAPPGVLG